MLRIQVPDWESEKEHYKIQLHEFFERVVRHGIETIENNKNLAEYIGSIISTKNLYDDVIGIGNIKIKLYKIEAKKKYLYHGQRFRLTPVERDFCQHLLFLHAC